MLPSHVYIMMCHWHGDGVGRVYRHGNQAGNFRGRYLRHLPTCPNTSPKKKNVSSGVAYAAAYLCDDARQHSSIWCKSNVIYACERVLTPYRVAGKFYCLLRLRRVWFIVVFSSARCIYSGSMIDSMEAKQRILLKFACRQKSNQKRLLCVFLCSVRQQISAYRF